MITLQLSADELKLISKALCHTADTYRRAGDEFPDHKKELHQRSDQFAALHVKVIQARDDLAWEYDPSVKDAHCNRPDLRRVMRQVLKQLKVKVG